MAQPTPMNRIVRTRELWPVDDLPGRQLAPNASKRRSSDSHAFGRELEAPQHLCTSDELSSSPFRQLYDNLQLVAGFMPRRVVMAAPSAAESVEPIVDGLARHAVACGRDVLTAALDLDGERPLLRGRDRNSAILEAPPVENLPRPIESWMTQGSAIDLLLIGAPPLTESIHAAMLARGCDGLVIVVQPHLTRRSHLRTAIERAEYAGCRILGLVVGGQAATEAIRRSAWSRMYDWIRRGTRV